ncbi:HTH-type transcriptional regulator McbR [Variovorax sp. SRS16]|uniref:GntR family transcriptional regulator n=1 Tax=Variovorax sp. SRS16 TaxID=282217 RepID=UPI001315DD41|nr:GntR family transcriptional regulator [Variovorax sp. SRS16]VTU14997.1 HTH-type transcriptional regulator McbR [Variovorax sp. SRS16]
MMKTNSKLKLRAANGDEVAGGPEEKTQPPGNLQERVYQQMRSALIAGHYVPGQSFTIRSLAAQFDTSVIPVRDALNRLVAERALEQAASSRSISVPRMSRAKFQEILKIRIALEPMITVIAVPHVTEEDIDAMNAATQDMSREFKAAQTRRFLAANQAFHFRLYRAAGTTVLMPIIESLWVQAGPYIHQVTYSAQGGEAAESHHLEILRSLRRGDAIGAAEAVRKDLADAADTILKNGEFVE